MKFVFYTDEIETDRLDEKNPQISAGAYAIQQWQKKNFEQCMYMMENARNIGFNVHHNYHNLSVTINITGEMTEQEYVVYRLKY